jgi:hypothetical protein
MQGQHCCARIKKRMRNIAKIVFIGAGSMCFGLSMFRTCSSERSCSDDHMGEYVPYGWEAGGHGYDFDQDERDRANF